MHDQYCYTTKLEAVPSSTCIQNQCVMHDMACPTTVITEALWRIMQAGQKSHSHDQYVDKFWQLESVNFFLRE
jgi:hypothetical protein